LLHIGVTAFEPPGGEVAWKLDPAAVSKLSWTVSTCGHVSVEGKFQHVAPIHWPEPSFAATRGPVPRGLRLALSVTLHGGLRLFAGEEGKLVTEAPPDTVPLRLTKGEGTLFPLVVLGPNVQRVTLRPVA
jgi:hypothetical protein